MTRLALLLALLPSLAGAQTCLPRAALVETLAARYGEHLTGRGLSGQVLVEVFRARDGASWTIVHTTADGRSCIVASGTDWVRTKLPAPGADS